MGEIADLMLDGSLCQECGVALDGEAPGHPRWCKTCRPGNPKMKCPRCGKRVTAVGLNDHIRDFHRKP